MADAYNQASCKQRYLDGKTTLFINGCDNILTNFDGWGECMNILYRGFAFWCVLFLFLLPSAVLASDLPNVSEKETKDFLLYFEKEDVVESATRGLKLASQVAENVSVITAEEILKTNARTLADVLTKVTGVQIIMSGWGGSPSQLYIQSSDIRHVAVYIDGVLMNVSSNNVADVASIPVQQIDKIEIIKGPASSAWGSSLGGVVNIFTKTGSLSGKVNGTLLASHGEKGTEEYRSEFFGELGAFNYYVTAGKMESDGLTPYNQYDGKSFYGKFGFKITKDTQLNFTSWYADADRQGGQINTQNMMFEYPYRKSLQTLSLDSQITREFKTSFTVRTSSSFTRQIARQKTTGNELQNLNVNDSGVGASVKAIYKKDRHNIVLGGDFDRRTLESPSIEGRSRRQEKTAGFINDTISIRDLALTPGIRYDDIETANPYVSSSIGLAYKLLPTTILRGYISKGFSAPPIGYTFVSSASYTPNTSLKNERVVSYQMGIETVALKYAWFKLSGFRHDIKDSITSERISATKFTYLNKEARRRQGVEAEIKTIPVYNTTLSLGGSFIDNQNLQNRKIQTNSPRYTYDAALEYDDKKSFNAQLRGHYIWWQDDAAQAGQYNDTIFDLTVRKILYRIKDSKIEAFGSVNNILNGKQYALGIYPTPGRWVEAGLRYTF